MPPPELTKSYNIFNLHFGNWQLIYPVNEATSISMSSEQHFASEVSWILASMATFGWCVSMRQTGPDSLLSLSRICPLATKTALPHCRQRHPSASNLHVMCRVGSPQREKAQPRPVTGDGRSRRSHRVRARCVTAQRCSGVAPPLGG